MKSLKLQSILLLAFALLALPSFGQGLKAFKLKNGLSVYIWEDNTKSDVYGIVACRTGSVNDPAEYTGLAHYLEHVMFKGTDKIGALDWEKEKPIYEQIIAKYDEMAEETDPLKKEAIGKEINDLTVEEGKISVSNEFMNLIESMGGKGLNAGTSYDVTYSVLFRQDFTQRLLATGTRTGLMMQKLLDEFTILHNKRWIDLGGCPVHDACAVAGVIDPTIVTRSEKMYVRIQTEPGPLSGATICDYQHRSGREPNAEVVFAMDNQRFFDLVVESAAKLK